MGRRSYKDGCGVAIASESRDPFAYRISNYLREDGIDTFGYIPPGKYVITTYFQPKFPGGEMNEPPVCKWNKARQGVTVQGDTEVSVHMESAKRN